MAPQWLPCHAPGVIGSVLGLVGQVSVYCDWVRWKVWSAASVSVRQHVKLSEQIRPWDTFACCWDVKQPTNKPWVPNVPPTNTAYLQNLVKHFHELPQSTLAIPNSHSAKTPGHQPVTWGHNHGGRRPSSDDSFHSPTVIPPSTLDKPSIMKRHHRRRTTRWSVTARSPTMVTLHDTRFVECRWWNDGWTVKTVVTWRSSASMIPAPVLAAGWRLYH